VILYFSAGEFFFLSLEIPGYSYKLANLGDTAYCAITFLENTGTFF